TSNSTGTVSTHYYPSGSDFTITRTNGAGQVFSKITDVSGKLIASIDNGITINFTYDSWGNQLTAPFTVNVYDSYGRKISTTDNANGHTYTYQYNSIGQLTQQTDELSNVQTVTYDVFGRVATTTGAQGTTTNTYYYDGI